jgi:hypothetical protein
MFHHDLELGLQTFQNVPATKQSSTVELLKLGISQLGPNSYLKKINKALHFKKV